MNKSERIKMVKAMELAKMSGGLYCDGVVSERRKRD
jgi:hypothetical protein